MTRPSRPTARKYRPVADVAQDVHGEAGVDDRNPFMCVAVHDRDLPRVTQDDAGEVLPVAFCLGFDRTIGNRNDQIPRFGDLCEVERRRRGRVELDEVGHQLDLVGRENSCLAPRRHTSGKTVGEDGCQTRRANLERPFRLDVWSGSTGAKGAVASGTSIEVDA